MGGAIFVYKYCVNADQVGGGATDMFVVRNVSELDFVKDKITLFITIDIVQFALYVLRYDLYCM